MFRRLVLGSIAVCALLFASACTQPKVIVDGGSTAIAGGGGLPSNGPPPPSPEQRATWGGLAVIAQPYIQYLFAPEEVLTGKVQAPPTTVQDSTRALLATVSQSKRLRVTALRSTDGSVALGFQETTPFHERWGGVMIPAQRRMFARFAADPSLGAWLIVVDDVIVTGGQDPVPLTAYRWPRSAVEAYATCGIPQSVEIEDCTHRFYSSGQTVLVIRQGSNAGQ